MQTSGKGMLRTAVLAALLLTFLCVNSLAATLKPGMKNAAVSQLQTDLKEKGYYSKTISDTYTNDLKKSVNVFQVANGIKPKSGYGIADDATQEKAASSDAVLYSEYIEKLNDAQLKPGGSGAYVKKAQLKLKSLGFYSGKIDSKYRSKTVAAVRDFQTANGLGVSGIADSKTRGVLYSDSAKTRAKYEEENYLTPLGIGAEGTQVTQLQERLTAMGYYWGEINGIYDPQTRYSVKFFQEANGFSATGKANQSLRALANKDSAVTFTEYTKSMQLIPLKLGAKPGIRIAVLQLRLKELGYYNGLISGAFTSSIVSAVRTFQIFNYTSSKYVTGRADAATRALMNKSTALKYSDVCGSNTLRPGDTGDAVKALETRLKELKYYEGDLDGVYDGALVSAVRLFQKYNSLYPTGVAYTNTLAAINSDSAKTYVNIKINELIEFADSHVEDEYTLGKRGPNQFDCSGFTYYCLKHMGISVSAEVQTQGRQMRKKFPRIITNYKELKRGDILYFWSPDHKKKPGHAGIFTGRKGSIYYFIHASSAADEVTYSNLNTTYYLGKNGAFLYGVRIWE